MIRGALAGGENQIGAAERTAAYGGEWLPDFDAVSADNCFHARGGETHGLGDGREIGVRGEDEFGVAASAAHGGGGEAAFGAFAAGENKFAAAYGHAVELVGIIEAEEAALHGAAGGEFGEHGGEVAAGALDAAGSVEFRKYADEHLGESAKRRDGTQAGEVAELFREGISYGFAFLEDFDLAELLRAMASRTSALKADASTSSPSRMSIARRMFPSRLELKRPAGSFRDAPLAKVSFTTLL